MSSKLSEYFSADVLAALNSLEQEALSNDFSPNQLRAMSGLPADAVKAQVVQATQAEVVRRITGIQPEELEVLMPWYIENMNEVHEIHCPSDGIIALEIAHPNLNSNSDGVFRHHEGKFTVPVGGNLLATRAREDGVMGYECLCGADTRVSDIEEELIPKSHLMTALSKEDIMRVKHQMNVRKYVPPVKKTKLGHKIEVFELRKVKA